MLECGGDSALRQPRIVLYGDVNALGDREGRCRTSLSASSRPIGAEAVREAALGWRSHRTGELAGGGAWAAQVALLRRFTLSICLLRRPGGYRYAGGVVFVDAPRPCLLPKARRCTLGKRAWDKTGVVMAAAKPGSSHQKPGRMFVVKSSRISRRSATAADPGQLEAETRKLGAGVSLTGCFCELERLDDLAQLRAGGCGRVGSVGGIDDQSLPVDVEDPQPVDLAGDLLV